MTYNHADYNNIDNFKNTNDNFKDLPYIVTSYSYDISLVNRKLLEYYSIVFNDDIMSKSEYIDIVFQLINKGAKFNNNNVLNRLNARQLMNKYSLILDFDSTQDDIDDDYKENYSKAINEFIEITDVREYDIKDKFQELLFDENSNMALDVGVNDISPNYNDFFIDYNNNQFVTDISDTILLLEPKLITNAVYIGENVTNNNVYKLANYLIGTEFLNHTEFYENFTTLKNDSEIIDYHNDVYSNLFSKNSRDNYKERNKDELERLKFIYDNKW